MTTHDIVELLLRRLDRQDEMLDGLDKKLDEHIRTEGDLRPALEQAVQVKVMERHEHEAMINQLKDEAAKEKAKAAEAIAEAARNPMGHP